MATITLKTKRGNSFVVKYGDDGKAPTWFGLDSSSKPISLTKALYTSLDNAVHMKSLAENPDKQRGRFDYCYARFLESPYKGDDIAVAYIVDGTGKITLETVVSAERSEESSDSGVLNLIMDKGGGEEAEGADSSGYRLKAEG